VFSVKQHLQHKVSDSTSIRPLILQVTNEERDSAGLEGFILLQSKSIDPLETLADFISK